MKKIAGIIFIIIGLSSQVAKAQKVALDKVVAVVGNAIILKSDLEMQYAQYLAQGNPADETLKCYFLQQLLTQKLLYGYWNTSRQIQTFISASNHWQVIC